MAMICRPRIPASSHFLRLSSPGSTRTKRRSRRPSASAISATVLTPVVSRIFPVVLCSAGITSEISEKRNTFRSGESFVFRFRRRYGTPACSAAARIFSDASMA